MNKPLSFLPLPSQNQGGVRVAYTEEIHQFGDLDGIDPGAIGRWLDASGALEFDPPSMSALQDMANDRARSGNNLLLRKSKGLTDDGQDTVENDEGTSRYDCGVDGCSKPFEHSHFLVNGNTSGGRGGGLPKDFEKPL